MRVRLVAVVAACAVLAAACATPDEPASGPAPAASEEPGAVEDDEPEVVATDEPAPAVTEETAPPATAAPVEVPEIPAGYELIADETGPAAKRAAVVLAQTLTTYEPDDRLEDVVARATSDPDLAAELEEAARPLFHEGAWSRGEIVYPQLGGLEPRATAVITAVRQRVGHPDGRETDHTRVLDVRVDRGRDGEWRVSALASAGGEPVPRPEDLGPEAVAVLDDERIELPDTARWDIHAGSIDPSLLRLMSRMAERTPYGVVVLQTGHSREVFGTTRQSRHAEGRAVDLYRVGEPHVISDRGAGSGTYDLVRWLYEQPELSEVGSPWALDGFGGRSFSDELHQDHVHVGVLRPDEEQREAPKG